MTAAGNTDRIEKAKKILVNGLIGLGIILAAFLIVTYIISTLTDILQRPPDDTGQPPLPPPCTGSTCPIGGPQEFAITSYAPPPLQFVDTPDPQDRNPRNA